MIEILGHLVLITPWPAWISGQSTWILEIWQTSWILGPSIVTPPASTQISRNYWKYMGPGYERACHNLAIFWTSLEFPNCCCGLGESNNLAISTTLLWGHHWGSLANMCNLDEIQENQQIGPGHRGNVKLPFSPQPQPHRGNIPRQMLDIPGLLWISQIFGNLRNSGSGRSQNGIAGFPTNLTKSRILLKMTKFDKIREIPKSGQNQRNDKSRQIPNPSCNYSWPAQNIDKSWRYIASP